MSAELSPFEVIRTLTGLVLAVTALTALFIAALNNDVAREKPGMVLKPGFFGVSSGFFSLALMGML